MCKEKRPLSTVNFLGDALSLNPTASTSHPGASQTGNGRTPEEISIFDSIYLPILTRNGIPITVQDREEMEFRGLPSISEAFLTMVRENQAREHHEQSFLDENTRLEEPEEDFSDFGIPTDDLGNLSDLGDPSFDLPELESDFPILPFEAWSPEPTPNQLQEPRDTVQAVGTDDARFGNELWDTVQTVSSDDARFGDGGYQSLRSNSRGSEREDGEMEDGEVD